MQLGLIPRLDVKRTSETQTGQIFVPNINTFLMVGVLGVMLAFQTSANLAHAYGLAVCGTMVVTTTMAFLVTRRLWKWPLWLALAFIGPLLLLDFAFLSANLLRFLSGGWFPITIAILLVLVMWTWTKGADLLREKTRRDSVPLQELIAMLQARQPHRISGTAIFLTSDPEIAPVALMHNLKHNKVLHDKNIILSVQTTESPRVAEADRLTIEAISPNLSASSSTTASWKVPTCPRPWVNAASAA